MFDLFGGGRAGRAGHNSFCAAAIRLAHDSLFAA
jgi:hypothetical protein